MPPPDRRFVRARRVFPAVDGEVLHDATVEVDGGTIVAVHAGDGSALPPDADVDDWGDATVLPGLIDAHAHVTLAADGRSYEQMAADPDELMALVAVENLRRHLAAGVTTVRDNGGRNGVTFAVRAAVERGYVLGPRLLVSGRPLTVTGGHFAWCNGVADGEEGIERAIRRLVAEGADHVKIMASGGKTAGTAPYEPSYSAAELRHAVQVAHGMGRLTTAHAHATASIANAVEAGLDCIEHADFVAPPPSGATGVLAGSNYRYDPRVGERLVESDSFVSYTVQCGGYHTLVRLRELEERGGLDAEQRRLRSDLERKFEMKLDVLAALLARDMHERIAISTDAGPSDTDFGHLAYGLELAVRGGMTPAQALRSATVVAARVCGIDTTAGTLEPGKTADLVVVRGDPTRDITAIGDVVAVYLDGRTVAPAPVPVPTQLHATAAAGA